MWSDVIAVELFPRMKEASHLYAILRNLFQTIEHIAVFAENIETKSKVDNKHVTKNKLDF